jgi:hypothetical protein
MRHPVQVSGIGFDPLKFATHFYAQGQGESWPFSAVRRFPV